ncbi:MAG: dethiobiotin synthase [Bacteroidetes bacterium]|nr:dethiobiotin synthase [Bacteroidota bacterium]
MRKIFVTGIGTDVGKTIVCAVLTEALKADYWKPVQCGTEPLTDSQLVNRLLTNITSKVHPEAYCFKQPVSPHAAGELEGVRIDLKKIVLPQTNNSVLIIEGAGGLMVPLNDTDLVADMISHLQAEVIVISSFYLGSINHTLLTCNELKRRNIPVTGIVFNGEFNKASADIILKQTGLKKLGTIAHETNLDKNTITRYASQFEKVV